MKVIHRISDMQSWSHKKRVQNAQVGFVPTMGALHSGHLALVRRAAHECDEVVVSIFVNPLQFGPKEDYRRYPRTLSRDLALLKKEAVDVVFVPSEREMYPHGATSATVSVRGLSDRLEGAFRPGHFTGVSTIVAKLFNIVAPTRAYFGEKDYQQLRVIAQMAQDLNLPVMVVACPTVRERDGLAMSSRNRFLSRSERDEAVKIYQALYLGRELIGQKIMTRTKHVVARLMQVLKTIPHGKVDYLEVVDPVTLAPMDRIKRPALLAAAVRLGKTRLIDNIVIS